MLFFGLLAGCRESQDTSSPSMDPEICILEAKKCIHSKHPKEAIKILEEYVQRSGNNSDEISELLASACLLNEDEELAAFYFEQAASLSELKYYCYLKAAEIYERLNDTEQALLCYRWYLSMLPEDNEIQIKYANGLILNGQKKKALPILLNIVEEIPVHNQIAELFFEFENYVQARNWYLLALGYEKNNLRALKGLWEVNLLLNDWETLHEIGSIFLNLNIKEIEYISIEEFMDSFKKARKAWLALSNTEINFGEITLPIFASEKTNGNPFIQKNLASTPQDLSKVTKNEKIEALNAIVRGAKDKGDYDEAIMVLWKILGLDGKNIDAWVDLTHCLLKVNKYDIAEMAIQEIIKFCPDRIEFHLTYLDIVIRTHSSTDYVRILEEIYRKFPQNPDILFRLAYIKEINDDAIAAKRFYEEFLKLAPPEHPEILKVKYLLKAFKEERR